MAKLELLHGAHDGGGLERFLQHRQHLQPVLHADALDVLEHGRAATAHQLDEAEIAALGEQQDRFDRRSRFQADAEEHELGVAPGQGLRHRLAVGELLGVDAGAMQDQRQEMADAGVLVDDVADRDAARRSGAVGRAVAGSVCRCALRSLNHRRRSRPAHNPKRWGRYLL
jgi:hypothetical protein